MTTAVSATDWSLSLPSRQADPPAVPDLVRRFRAMATDVTMRVVGPHSSAEADLARAEAVFAHVEAACTRFDPNSPLMRANAFPGFWHSVPPECLLALREAARAHVETGGLFDPRVLDALRAVGYDRSLPFDAHDVRVVGPVAPAVVAPATRGPWRPEFDLTTSSVRIGSVPVDLGGIGKGLAVRWAAEELARAGRAVLVEAGGDCHLGGAGPEGEGWSVGIEDPLGGTEPVAVLRLSDRACATSSVRVRRWLVDGESVHHLIDPTTGRPGGEGLLAVTVVDPDAARAEVWSKSLFLCGRDAIAEVAEQRGIAAGWVTDDGTFVHNEGLASHLAWERS